MFALYFGLSSDADAQVKTTDSVFVKDSRPINFIVDRVDISEQDRQWITETLIPELQRLGDNGIVLGRSAASPEGPYLNNRRLAYGRCASMNSILSSFGIDTGRIRYDVAVEDYPLLRTLMLLAHDAQLSTVDSIMACHEGNEVKLKEALKRYDGGALWRRLLDEYFPQLRAVRIMAIDKTLLDNPLARPLAFVPSAFDFSVFPAPLQMDIVPPVPVGKMPRRELLSVKTNLLFDFAYMPGYDRFCPIPNVAIEYYPLHGHFTYGASVDFPWWQHYNMHKYFQIRNYQLHTRYYLRSGDVALRRPGEGAAFKGTFFSAYAHANLYNICFGEKRGWEGEGWGAGLGVGYVLPLGRSEHWRLEFGLQAGFYMTDYDPYQWRCPVNPDTDPELYYYKWYGDAKDFKKRQHRYTWFGPTRAEITLSYDIIYRKRPKK